MTSGTLVDITPVKATIKVISEVDATIVDRTLPIGPAVKPYAEGLKQSIEKEVIYTVKKDLKDCEYYSFIKAAEAPVTPVSTGTDKRKRGLLLYADTSGFSIRINGKTSRYAGGGQNKHIIDRAQEFGTFPLWVMFRYDGSGFLTKDSEIVGVPTKEELAAELETFTDNIDTTPAPAKGPQPANVKCQVCEAELTEAELKMSNLFLSRSLCKKCLGESEGALGAKKAPGRAPVPEEKAAEKSAAAAVKEIVQETKGKPASVKEGIAPPAPAAPQEVNTQEPARPLTPPAASRISISVTINLGNYESLKVGVDGDTVDRDRLRALLRDELQQYGRTNELAKTAIDSYRKRILGGAV